jgi:hypothetical protein
VQVIGRSEAERSFGRSTDGHIVDQVAVHIGGQARGYQPHLG